MEEFGPPTNDSVLAVAGDDNEVRGRIDVGIVFAHTSRGSAERLRTFAAQLATDVAEEFERATDVSWRFYGKRTAPLPDATDCRPAEDVEWKLLRVVGEPQPSNYTWARDLNG